MATSIDTCQKLTPPEFIIVISVIVSIYAIGSLLPLSNSNRGRRLFFKTVPLERNIPKTEAESVDEVVAANNKAVRIPMPKEGINALEIHQTKNPVNIAVITTPTVANTTPG